MNLWQQYLANKEKANGPYFPKEGAIDLGVSEGALMADSPQCVYLGKAFREVVLELHTLGLVESIVRNSLAVHEKKGIYENVTLAMGGGLALNIGGLDLRFYPRHWHHVLAIETHTNDKITRSIQFYDEFGVAIEKVFLRDDSKETAWQALVQRFRSMEKPDFIHRPMPPVEIPQPLTPEREKAFQERWLELKDVHHYSGLLETFNLDRQQSYRHAPTGWATQLDNAVWESTLNRVHDSGMELMIFVGNRGLVQIQTGKVHHVVRMHDYLNILDGKTDEGFNLHLKDKGIVETWVVRRPVRDGFVTCLEGFDERRKTVVQFFGRRQEGEKELPTWEVITNELLG